MAYVVYNIQSTQTVNEKRWGRETFKTEAAAKAARTRMIKRQKYDGAQLAVAEVAFYTKNIAGTGTRTNLMTGKTYQESVNTPMCCSPSSETYWSM
jgi:phosphoribosylformylglycinamidine (FGAM) synthase-like enzyme